MAAGMKVVLFSLIIIVPLSALFVYLIILAVRALRKYIKGSPARQEAKTVRTTLGEKLRENGKSDPSASNLVALAKLYGLSAVELLEGL